MTAFHLAASVSGSRYRACWLTATQFVINVIGETCASECLLWNEAGVTAHSSNWLLLFSVAGFWLAERRRAWRARWRDWSMKAWRWTKRQERCVFSKRSLVCFWNVNVSLWLDRAAPGVFHTWRAEERAEINTMTVASQRGAQWPRKRRKTKRRMCLFFPAWTATSSASNTSRYSTFNVHLLIYIHKSGIHSKVLNIQQTKCFRIFKFHAVKIIIVSSSGGTKPLQITPKFWVSPPKQVIRLVMTCLVVASSSLIYNLHVLHSAMYVNEIIFGFIFTNWGSVT